MRFSNWSTNEWTCSNCKNQVNENKEFEANLDISKRQAPNQFGHMLPYYEEWLMWHLFFWEWFHVRLNLEYFYWKGFLISTKSSLIKEYFDERKSIMILWYMW